MEYFRESIDVSIPTNAMIPKEMIRIVSTVLNKWLFIDLRETLIFSLSNNFTGNGIKDYSLAKIMKNLIEKRIDEIIKTA